MPETIISDTSCFILLEKIGEIDLLQKLFGKVIITPEVLAEFGLPLPAWVEIREPSDKNYLTTIGLLVDKGEASAIALALEHKDSLLIIDESKGRKLAAKLGLTITGTFGLLVDAKLEGHIPLVKPLLYKIRQTNFRISEEIENLILVRAGE